MDITVDEVKNYLKVDTKDDDLLIASLIVSAKTICMSVIRKEKLEKEDEENFRLGVYYSVAYLYENREKANHKDLLLTLRALLFSMRKDEF